MCSFADRLLRATNRSGAARGLGPVRLAARAQASDRLSVNSGITRYLGVGVRLAPGVDGAVSSVVGVVVFGSALLVVAESGVPEAPTPLCLAAASSAACFAFFASSSFRTSIIDFGWNFVGAATLGVALISLGRGALGAPGGGSVSQPPRRRSDDTRALYVVRDVVMILICTSFKKRMPGPERERVNRSQNLRARYAYPKRSRRSFARPPRTICGPNLPIKMIQPEPLPEEVASSLGPSRASRA
jgi:hypothetical protein